MAHHNSLRDEAHPYPTFPPSRHNRLKRPTTLLYPSTSWRLMHKDSSPSLYLYYYGHTDYLIG